MPSLQKIYVALGNIIDEYCKPKNPQENYTIEIREEENESVVSKQPISHEAKITLYKTNKRYSLLMYLLYGRKLLHPLVHVTQETAEILEQGTLEFETSYSEICNKFTEFMLNLKRALQTSNTSTISIHYEEQTVDIVGCVLISGSLCTSGSLIEKHLFSLLYIDLKSVISCKDENIRLQIEGLVNSYEFLLYKPYVQSLLKDYQALQNKVKRFEDKEKEAIVSAKPTSKKLTHQPAHILEGLSIFNFLSLPPASPHSSPPQDPYDPYALNDW